MKRAETRERNRRALLNAALQIVARDGHQARLDEIAGQAGLTTGAVYSLFGSKNGLLAALAADYLGPQYDEIERAVPAGLDLEAAVDAFARYYRRRCDDPDALRGLALQASMLDTAARDPDLGARLAVSIRSHEERLVALFTGRPHNGSTVTPEQAQRLATALRALLAGLSQGVLAGLAPAASEQFFAETARALVSDASLLDQPAAPLPHEPAPGHCPAAARLPADTRQPLSRRPGRGPPAIRRARTAMPGFYRDEKSSCTLSAALSASRARERWSAKSAGVVDCPLPEGPGRIPGEFGDRVKNAGALDGADAGQPHGLRGGLGVVLVHQFQFPAQGEANCLDLIGDREVLWPSQRVDPAVVGAVALLGQDGDGGGGDVGGVDHRGRQSRVRDLDDAGCPD